jgi:threonine/homoserine/homoserine lactone efflux protein
MLLQFAVGPVCLFIFQTASIQGFYAAEAGMLGVAVMDGLFILAAILGIASVIEKKNIRRSLKVFGAIILLIFGMNLVFSLVDINLLPGLRIADSSGTNNAFVYAVILTVSSPLTILFWAGVFATKIAEDSIGRKDIYAFGLGALLSTVFFLTLIALAGSLTQGFVTPIVMKAMNFTVGILFMYFAVKMILKK